MAKKTINFHLSESEITRVRKEVKKYRAWIKQKTAALAERLAMLGLQEASVRFMGAHYDAPIGNDTQLSVVKKGNGYKIVASGTQVWFVEFGAGVYYNGGEPYPNPPGRPSGVLGIGQYGKGHGLRDTWYYTDDDGSTHRTHGTPAAMPMYHASQEIQRQIYLVAKEVFGNDRY